MKPFEELRSKYAGCMVGAAIGDALGKQNEGLLREDIIASGYITNYGKATPGCPGEKLKEGQYTDDTEQMIVLAQSILECGGFNVDDFAKRIAKWGADAMNDPARKSLVGPSSAAAIARLNSGMNWKKSGSDTPSCGSAMRVAPIGLFYEVLKEVELNAALSSIPTHNSKAAIAGAVAVAVAVRCALDGMDCHQIIKETRARASNHDIGLGKKIGLSYRLRTEPPHEAFSRLGTSYLVNETVPSAFYCFSRHFNSSENAVIEAVNAGGDTDSIACITGALCGAVHGIDSFPGKWIQGLENIDMIEHLAGLIFETG
ncbi:MAG: ADP-ribosylglycohydrolase family protein [Candidatus Methanoperedens sp.]